METIREIRDLVENDGVWGGVEGYEIVTDTQSIKLTIDNSQSCCERWGYFWCNDNPQDFVGAAVLDVTLTDTALNEARMNENAVDPSDRWFDGSVMFVNIATDRGTLQFVAYNEHNGYYGHEARVECRQLQHCATL